VRAESVRVEQRRSKAVVDLSERRLSIIDGGIETWSTPVAVGGSGTPTPTGRFHVTGPVGTGDPRGPYGPWVIGLSGFSEALDSFDGGAPGLAVHGTNRPERIGQAVSNGCIRVPNESLDVLLVHLVPGTVVDVHE
jgi:lipoprotein-anchoring transpeptidase ErfK/SrfK